MSEPDVATRESATKRRGRKLERPLQKRRVEFEETLLKARALMRAVARTVHGEAGEGRYTVEGG